MASLTQTYTLTGRTLRRTTAMLALLASYPLLAANQSVLTWSDNSDNEDGFSIERSVSGGSFEVIAQVGADVETYADTTVETGFEYQYRVNAFNEFGYSGYTNTATRYVNTAPTVSTISDVEISENGSATGIPFTIGDAEVSASELEVSVSSSNVALLDEAGISLGGSGASRTLSLTPKVNAAGESTVVVSVSDGVDTVESSFLFTVNSFGFPTIDFAVDSIGSSPRAGEAFSIVSTVSDASKVSSVSYLVDGELVASSEVSPYEVDLTLPESGSYALTAVANIVGRDETVTAEQVLFVEGPPADTEFVEGLKTISTDEATTEGMANYDLGTDTFYVEDAGGKIEGKTDTHRFFYVRVNGNVTVSAKLNEVLASSDYGVAGLMLRSALYGKSVQSSLLVNGAGELETRTRTSTGGDIEILTGATTGTTDVWLKLERIGETLSAYYKTSEGGSWILAQQSQVTLEDPIFVGFAVAAGAGDTLAAAEFTDALLEGEILAWDESSTKPEMPGLLIISQANE